MLVIQGDPHRAALIVFARQELTLPAEVSRFLTYIGCPPGTLRRGIMFVSGSQEALTNAGHRYMPSSHGSVFVRNLFSPTANASCYESPKDMCYFVQAKISIFTFRCGKGRIPNLVNCFCNIP